MSLEDEVRDPYLLGFLNLKDEYSEGEAASLTADRLALTITA